MASYESQECCIKGVKHEGTPKGKIETVADRRTYITHPEKPNGNAVLIFTDVLGIDFPNTQLVADQFAANGYLTVMPDVFGENVISLNRPADFDFQDWKANKMPRPAFVDPIYEKTIQYLRKEAGVKRIGGVGYCFGGKYVCRWLKTGQLDAGYTAHPSFVDAEEVEGIQGPLSIAAAETDIIFPAEKRHETEAILQKHTVPYQMFLYSDVEHGFAVKGDMDSAKGKFAKEQAFFQAIQWFDEFVKKGSDWKL